MSPCSSKAPKAKMRIATTAQIIIRESSIRVTPRGGNFHGSSSLGRTGQLISDWGQPFKAVTDLKSNSIWNPVSR